MPVPSHMHGLIAAPRGADAAHTIVSIVDDGSGNLLLTTAAAHGLSAGPSITLAGTSGGLYNGGFTIDDVPTLTTMVSLTAFLGGSIGGTWSL